MPDPWPVPDRPRRGDARHPRRAVRRRAVRMGPAAGNCPGGRLTTVPREDDLVTIGSERRGCCSAARSTEACDPPIEDVVRQSLTWRPLSLRAPMEAQRLFPSAARQRYALSDL